MKSIHVTEIERTVSELCITANKTLSPDITDAISAARVQETLPLAADVMADLERNLDAAKKLNIPICQDTGMAVVFVELGQDVHITGGLLADAINSGVARGYTEGLLRCSVVADPLSRANTGDNTPAVVHLSLVAGDSLKITVAPKGFGSENMSRIKMLTPASGREDIIVFIEETVRIAGSNPCPPMILGVGIGGNFELCALLAKKALCRPLNAPNPDSVYASIEREALRRVNATGIGPQGFGGVTTALGVQIETYPTHIAGLPVAVNVGCHVTRHASAILG